MTAPDGGALAGLDFTDRAWKLAEDERLTAADFEGIEPAGKHGEYLVEQVEEVIAQKRAAEEPAAPAPAEEETPAKPVGDFGIRESTWNDMPNYHCPECPFDSIDLERVRTHYIQRHLPAPEPRPSSIVVTDRHGNPITPEE